MTSRKRGKSLGDGKCTQGNDGTERLGFCGFPHLCTPSTRFSHKAAFNLQAALATGTLKSGIEPRTTEKGLLITRSSDKAAATSQDGRPLWSWRRGVSLALTLTAAGIYSDAASAIEPRVVAPAPAPQWCLDRRDGNSDQPACYESLITCVAAALAHASWCTHRVPESVVAMNRRAPSVASVSRHRTHASLGQHKFTAAERDDLYQAFEKWKGRSTDE